MGAGRKPKETKVLNLDGQAADIQGVAMPKIKAYLNEKQKNGKPLGARKIFRDMFDYLAAIGCAEFVPTGLIEQYAICTARWIQLEEEISANGFLAKHPTTGGAIRSPYIDAAQDYMKQANQALFQINGIVKENRVVDLRPNEVPENDLLKRLRERRAT